ncbi:MAG TPA: M28 family peptidase, partial [Vicinamibacterales bacterium]|nr:M28 family peptidase [Vicinamibacterales bacterium]
RVSNIVAVLGGARDEAIGLLSHYDSDPDAPGAADDAFGVAVSLEAARILASRAERQWSLMVLVTDGEEAGLMGAAALMTDREVTSRLQAYLNIEAAGSNGPAHLFETGPGNGWLVEPWARYAPHPGGASFGVEIYRRLPNDTDFSILRRHEIPGLNFALIGDSYAYHTARDTPERLSPASLRETGENVVAVVSAMDGIDITERSQTTPTYFDIGRTTAITYGPLAGWAAAALALLSGVFAWVRITAAAIRLEGLGRWLLTTLWTAVGAALVVGSMVGVTLLLRAAREVYHPWYARPDRLFLLMLAVGIAVAWSVARIGQWLPERAHGLRHPLITWSMALPLWIALGSASLWLAPGAAYLWVLPLLAAGLLLAVIPVASSLAVRAASIVVLAVAATLWLRDTLDLLRFMVAVFGRLPLVTPAYFYAALMAVAGIMLVPPAAAIVTRSRPLVRPALMTAIWLIAVVVASGLAYSAPAYTVEQPLRRLVRAIQPAPDAEAIWDVASIEPGLDLPPGAPSGWMPANDPPATAIPSSRLPHPFVFRTKGPSLGPPPMAIAGFSIEPVAGGVEMTLTVVPREPGLVLTFVLPDGAVPARSNLPGIRRLGRWRATFVAPPEEGIVFRASFDEVSADALRETRVVVSSARFPDGEGWQRLPGWLPQEWSVWSAAAVWHVPAAQAPPVAPALSLR